MGNHSFSYPRPWRVFHNFRAGFMPFCGISCWKTVWNGDKKVASLSRGTFRLSRMFRVCRVVLQGFLVGGGLTLVATHGREIRAGLLASI